MNAKRRTTPMNGSQRNAPIGAVNFFVHGVAIYATFAVLQRANRNQPRMETDWEKAES